jgi:hypothetical protein
MDPEQDSEVELIAGAYIALMPLFQKYSAMLFPALGDTDSYPSEMDF